MSAIYHFQTADMAVFGITVAISVSIGLYHAFAGGKQRTTSEYLMGNRQMSVIPTALSLLVTFESSIMMLGVPAEIYVYGVMFWLSIVAFFFSGIVSSFVFVPLLHPLKLNSAYEYLQMRFQSRVVRKIATLLSMVQSVWYMGIVLYGPGIALEVVSGFSFWTTTLVIAGASVFYTCIGGIKAVIWTDVFQCVIMFGGMLAVIIQGVIYVGGISDVFSINLNNQRLNLFDFNPDPTVRHTFFTLMGGSFIRSLWFPFSQATIQRICGTPNVKAGQKVMIIASVGFVLMSSVSALQGLVAYAYFHTKECDPLESNAIDNPNQIIPYMVVDLFRRTPGIPGLYIAALFSACLSTLSSILSSLASLTWEEIVKPFAKDCSEYQATIVAKISVIVYGLLAVCVSVMVSMIGGTLTQITASLLEAFGSPVLGLFCLGIFCPWANWKGAIVGAVVAYIGSTWISMGSNFSPNRAVTPWLPPAPTNQCLIMNTSDSLELMNNINFSMNTTPLMSTESIITIAQGIDKLYTISYLWVPVIGMLTVIIVGTVISYFTGFTKPSDIIPEHIVNVCGYCFCLPKKVKYFLSGVDPEKQDDVSYNKDETKEMMLRQTDVELDIKEDKLVQESK